MNGSLRGAGRKMVRAFWIQPFVGAIVLVGPGCGGDQTGGIGVSVRDSAGVEIVEHEGNLWEHEPTWHVASEPELRIGKVDGEAAYLFDGITGIVPLSDGRIVVANSGDGTLRWFERTGQFVFQRGGVGEGPGEFRRLSGITSTPADSIVAVDWVNRRFTPFGPDGGLGQTVPILGLTAPPGRAYRLSSGEWIVGTSGMSTAQLGGKIEPGVYRFDSPILRLGADGTSVDTIGMFPGSEGEVRMEGSRISFGPAQFGHSLSYAVSGDHVVVGTGDQLQIEVYGESGEHVRSVRAPDVNVALSPNIADAYRTFLRSRLENAPPDTRPEAERRIADMHLPLTMPAYSTILSDDSGNVWVGEYRYDFAPAQRYLVFNPEGRFVTTVTVPPNFRIMAVSGDRVWGRATDEFDVHYVVGYRLERADN